jgi:hypothetical protein
MSGIDRTDIRNAFVDHINDRVTGYINELNGMLRERGMIDSDQSVRNGTLAHNNSLDAIRHAYVTGRLAMDFGAPAALEMGRFHEHRNTNPADETRMDLHNNHMGMRFAVNVMLGSPGQGLTQQEMNEQLFNRLTGAVERGELITHPSQSRPRVGELRSDAGDGAVQVASAAPQLQGIREAIERTPGMQLANVDERGQWALAATAAERNISPNLAGVTAQGGFVSSGRTLDDPLGNVATVSVRDLQQPVQVSQQKLETAAQAQTQAAPNPVAQALVQETESRSFSVRA